jgi:hypothetical protein
VTKSDGRCKIDAVEVGELEFKALGPQPPVLSVRYAYANAQTGDRYGSSNRNQGWSERTLKILSSLVESVEADVARDLFNDSATISSGVALDVTTTDSIPSL